HGPGLEVGGIAHGGLDLAAGGYALSRFQTERAQLRRKGVERGAGESAERDRGRDIDHARLIPKTECGGGSGESAGEVALEEGGALPGCGRRGCGCSGGRGRG